MDSPSSYTPFSSPSGEGHRDDIPSALRSGIRSPGDRPKARVQVRFEEPVSVASSEASTHERLTSPPYNGNNDSCVTATYPSTHGDTASDAQQTKSADGATTDDASRPSDSAAHSSLDNDDNESDSHRQDDHTDASHDDADEESDLDRATDATGSEADAPFPTFTSPSSAGALQHPPLRRFDPSAIHPSTYPSPHTGPIHLSSVAASVRRATAQAADLHTHHLVDDAYTAVPYTATNGVAAAVVACLPTMEDWEALQAAAVPSAGTVPTIPAVQQTHIQQQQQQLALSMGQHQSQYPLPGQYGGASVAPFGAGAFPSSIGGNEDGGGGGGWPRPHRSGSAESGGGSGGGMYHSGGSGDGDCFLRGLLIGGAPAHMAVGGDAEGAKATSPVGPGVGGGWSGSGAAGTYSSGVGGVYAAGYGPTAGHAGGNDVIGMWGSGGGAGGPKARPRSRLEPPLSAADAQHRAAVLATMFAPLRDAEHDGPDGDGLVGGAGGSADAQFLYGTTAGASPRAAQGGMGRGVGGMAAATTTAAGFGSAIGGSSGSPADASPLALRCDDVRGGNAALVPATLFDYDPRLAPCGTTGPRAAAAAGAPTTSSHMGSPSSPSIGLAHRGAEAPGGVAGGGGRMGLGAVGSSYGGIGGGAGPVAAGAGGDRGRAGGSAAMRFVPWWERDGDATTMRRRATATLPPRKGPRLVEGVGEDSCEGWWGGEVDDDDDDDDDPSNVSGLGGLSTAAGGISGATDGASGPSPRASVHASFIGDKGTSGGKLRRKDRWRVPRDGDEEAAEFLRKARAARRREREADGGDGGDDDGGFDDDASDGVWVNTRQREALRMSARVRTRDLVATVGGGRRAADGSIVKSAHTLRNINSNRSAPVHNSHTTGEVGSTTNPNSVRLIGAPDGVQPGIGSDGHGAMSQYSLGSGLAGIGSVGGGLASRSVPGSGSSVPEHRSANGGTQGGNGGGAGQSHGRMGIGGTNHNHNTAAGGGRGGGAPPGPWRVNDGVFGSGPKETLYDRLARHIGAISLITGVSVPDADADNREVDWEGRDDARPHSGGHHGPHNSGLGSDVVGSGGDGDADVWCGCGDRDCEGGTACPRPCSGTADERDRATRAAQGLGPVSDRPRLSHPAGAAVWSADALCDDRQRLKNATHRRVHALLKSGAVGAGDGVDVGLGPAHASAVGGGGSGGGPGFGSRGTIGAHHPHNSNLSNTNGNSNPLSRHPKTDVSNPTALCELLTARGGVIGDLYVVPGGDGVVVPTVPRVEHDAMPLPSSDSLGALEAALSAAAAATSGKMSVEAARETVGGKERGRRAAGGGAGAAGDTWDLSLSRTGGGAGGSPRSPYAIPDTPIGGGGRGPGPTGARGVRSMNAALMMAQASSVGANVNISGGAGGVGPAGMQSMAMGGGGVGAQQKSFVTGGGGGGGGASASAAIYAALMQTSVASTLHTAGPVTAAVAAAAAAAAAVEAGVPPHIWDVVASVPPNAAEAVGVNARRAVVGRGDWGAGAGTGGGPTSTATATGGGGGGNGELSPQSAAAAATVSAVTAGAPPAAAAAAAAAAVTGPTTAASVTFGFAQSGAAAGPLQSAGEAAGGAGGKGVKGGRGRQRDGAAAAGGGPGGASVPAGVIVPPHGSPPCGGGAMGAGVYAAHAAVATAAAAAAAATSALTQGGMEGGGDPVDFRGGATGGGVGGGGVGGMGMSFSVTASPHLQSQHSLFSTHPAHAQAQAQAQAHAAYAAAAGGRGVRGGGGASAAAYMQSVVTTAHLQSYADNAARGYGAGGGGQRSFAALASYATARGGGRDGGAMASSTTGWGITRGAGGAVVDPWGTFGVGGGVGGVGVGGFGGAGLQSDDDARAAAEAATAAQNDLCDYFLRRFGTSGIDQRAPAVAGGFAARRCEELVLGQRRESRARDRVLAEVKRRGIAPLSEYA